MLQAGSLPGSLMRVLEPFRPCFTARGFETFVVLVAGLVAALGGEARNRMPIAAERTVPFALCAQSIVVIWYHLAGHSPRIAADRRRAAPWYLGCRPRPPRRRLLPCQADEPPPPHTSAARCHRTAGRCLCVVIHTEIRHQGWSASPHSMDSGRRPEAVANPDLLWRPKGPSAEEGRLVPRAWTLGSVGCEQRDGPSAEASGGRDE